MSKLPAVLRIRLAAAILLAFASSAPPAFGEDIDIYAGAGVAADRANVLIVLDSSANWSASIAAPNCYYKENGIATTDGPRASSPNKEQGTKMAIEKCALYNLIDSLPVADDGSALFNVGLMLFNESPASNSGGYPRKAILPLDAVAKTAFKNVIRNITINGDKGNNAAFAKSLYEAYLYLRSDVPYRGTAGAKWDRAAVIDGRYSSPSASSCSRNYVIFVANGGPGEVTDNEAKALLAAAGGDVAQITYPTSYVSNSDQANWADEFARFMFGADVSSMGGAQSIVTHAIAVTGAASDGRYPNFIKSIAKYGGGSYYEASDADTLSLNLASIFAQIQSVSSVFASASLPISVNARGAYLNQVFMGMFLPDGNAAPRWYGNLRQYQFAYDQPTDTLRLVDSLGQAAISASSGFIVPDAVSFWTTPSSFWVNAPAGTPLSGSDSPDGEVVAKGGAAQVLRESILTDQSSRKVLTCNSCARGAVLGASDATQFKVTNAAITSAALGVATAAERDTLIDWVRGTDNAGDERGPGGGVTVRPSVHGDVLHSRPAVVNYGGSTGVVVFYGANDGMLHAVAGDQTGADAGETLWSFLPEELYPYLKRLRDNDPIIAYPNIPAVVPSARRDYFVDGPIAVYQKVNASGATEAVHLYVGMRRGGRFFYALDVTDPGAPRLLWKKSNADVAVLGQTWSEPRVIKVRGRRNPVLIMGAGYDAAAEDVLPAGSVTMGNAILAFDAIDGTLLKQFGGIDRPVPADVSVVDTDFDGYVDRAYAVDLGGRIYRLDFEVDADVDVDDWTSNVLADLSDSPGKKFFHAPDVVLTRHYAVVLAGSGDREKPLSTGTQDYFYTVIDRHLGKGVGAGFTTLRFADLVDQSSFSPSPSAVGCYLTLETGEKVVNAPLTIAGTTYFGTNKPTPPTPGTCSTNLGLARTYSAPLICRNPAATGLVGGGLPPSPVAGVVRVDYENPQTGESETRLVPFIIGGENERRSAIEATRIRIPIPPRRSKLYWHTETDR